MILYLLAFALKIFAPFSLLVFCQMIKCFERYSSNGLLTRKASSRKRGVNESIESIANPWT